MESADDARARELSLGVAHGERASVAAFYEEWFDWTQAAAKRASGMGEAFCLDVVQDVMLRVAGRMPAMRTRADVERWMSRVIVNACRDRLRSERRRAAREKTAISVLDEQTCNDRLAWLNEQLDKLDADERMLLRLRFGQAMTLRAIAEGVGLSVGAVHGRVRSALARLRREDDDHE